MVFMSIQSPEYHKDWRHRNKDKVHEYYLRDYAKRKEAIREKRCSPEYRNKLSEYLKLWRKKHSEKIKSDMLEWAKENKDWIREYRKSYAERRRFLYHQNKGQILPRKRELAKTYKYRARIQSYRRRRRRQDIQFTLKDRLRVTMSRALRRQFVKKSLRTMELIGCTPEELRSHIEHQFKPGMTWQNRNEWHVDHIRPLASFDLRDVEQQRIAFNWKNLQPLWAWENQQKSDNLLPSVDGTSGSERLMRVRMTKTLPKTLTACL